MKYGWNGERFTDISRTEPWGLRMQTEKCCIDDEYHADGRYPMHGLDFFYMYRDIHIEVPQP